MADLTIEQRRILDELRAAKAAKASARARIEAENRERLESGLRQVEDALNRRVREAHEAGISKRKIGMLGLGTSDPTIVNRLLAKTAAAAAITEAVAKITRLPIRELTPAMVRERGLPEDPHADLWVSLDYPDFPSAWKGNPAEYPNPLRGVLKRVFGLWSVVEDPSEVFLAWELDELEPNGGVLVQILEAYAHEALSA